MVYPVNQWTDNIYPETWQLRFATLHLCLFKSTHRWTLTIMMVLSDLWTYTTATGSLLWVRQLNKQQLGVQIVGMHWDNLYFYLLHVFLLNGTFCAWLDSTCMHHPTRYLWLILPMLGITLRTQEKQQHAFGKTCFTFTCYLFHSVTQYTTVTQSPLLHQYLVYLR